MSDKEWWVTTRVVVSCKSVVNGLFYHFRQQTCLFRFNLINTLQVGLIKSLYVFILLYFVLSQALCFIHFCLRGKLGQCIKQALPPSSSGFPVTRGKVAERRKITFP